MFSGIIEAVGSVSRVTPKEGAVELEIETPQLAAELSPGDSVAVDGACLTVEVCDAQSFKVTAVATTLDRTVASGYAAGSRVNLERALQIGTRLDGHFVQGHVDGLGKVTAVHAEGADVKLHVEVPVEVARVTLPRGSITLNGVSLTVAEGPGGAHDRQIGIAAIPFTLAETNLGDLVPGDLVNVEADLIGKYVGRMVASTGASDPFRPSATPSESSTE